MFVYIDVVKSYDETIVGTLTFPIIFINDDVPVIYASCICTSGNKK